jgi:hypothetical protein
LETSKVKAITTNLKEMLVDGGKDDSILDNIMEKYYEFIVIGHKLPLSDALNKVVSMSNYFPLPRKFLSTVDMNSLM